MEWDILGGLSIFAVGIFAGIANTLAGGGSILVLPLLIFLGIPSPLANGTNRVAILLQNTAALFVFYRKGLLEFRLPLLLAIPALIGAWFGAGIATRISAEDLNKVLAWVILTCVALSLFPVRRNPRTGKVWMLSGLFLFLFVGLYGGFIHAGVGFFIIAVCHGLMGLELRRTNVIKVTVVWIFTVLALGRFLMAGQVHWGLAANLSIGNVLGAALAARWVSENPPWVKWFIPILGLCFAVKLLLF